MGMINGGGGGAGVDRGLACMENRANRSGILAAGSL